MIALFPLEGFLFLIIFVLKLFFFGLPPVDGSPFFPVIFLFPPSDLGLFFFRVCVFVRFAQIPHITQFSFFPPPVTSSRVAGFPPPRWTHGFWGTPYDVAS